MSDSGRPPKATALYGRTSKDDPKRVTIEIQQRFLREWAAADRDSPLVEEYWDDGVTGKLPLHERPAGRRLLEDVQAGKVGTIAVMYADRFGRTLLDALEAVKRLEPLGVKLVAAHDGWDARRNDSPLYFQFRLMMAEEEHRRIRQRTSDGIARAMARDEAPPGGPLVFGYRLDERGRFVLHPEEAAVVVQLFTMALQGRTIVEMAAWASTAGPPPGRRYQKRTPGAEMHIASDCKSGATWKASKVSRLLRNRTYLGERRWGSHLFRCPPLIDEDSFLRVQALLAERSRRWNSHPGRAAREHGFLSGVPRCSICGSRFYHTSQVDRRGAAGPVRRAYYICRKAKKGHPNTGLPDGPRCQAKLLRVEEVDRLVWEALSSYLADPGDLLRRVVAGDGRRQADAEGLAAGEAEADAEAARLDAEVREIWAMQRANNWPLNYVTQTVNERQSASAAAKQRAAELRRRRQALVSSREEAEAVAQALAGLRAELAGGEVTFQLKAKLARLLISSLTVVTAGEGQRKTAELHLELPWGEAINPQARPGLPRENGPQVSPELPHYPDSRSTRATQIGVMQSLRLTILVPAARVA
jgi:site-specific DNA recombinase